MSKPLSMTATIGTTKTVTIGRLAQQKEQDKKQEAKDKK